jgi:acetyl-CoA acyltransferase 1
VTVKGKDGSETQHEVLVDANDGIRDGVTAESLAKLKPAFTKDGCTHAGRCSFLTLCLDIPLLILRSGNASQVSDGTAAVLLARRSVARRLGLPIIGKYVAAAVVGVPPRIMGVSPAYAIPRMLENAGITKNDVDFWEINEAFASQALYSIQTLGLDQDRVNVHGGAIAIGHPLGCSECSLFRWFEFSDILCCSWCEADCNGLEHRETVWRKGLCDEHVYR